jgi:hypothetical protein
MNEPKHIDEQEPRRYRKTAQDVVGHENMAKLDALGLMIVSRSEYWRMVARIAETPEDKAYYEHVAMHDQPLLQSDKSVGPVTGGRESQG